MTWPILEARAEIQKHFCSFFGSNEDIHKSFWNYLTFSMPLIKLFTATYILKLHCGIINRPNFRCHLPLYDRNCWMSPLLQISIFHIGKSRWPRNAFRIPLRLSIQLCSKKTKDHHSMIVMRSKITQHLVLERYECKAIFTAPSKSWFLKNVSRYVLGRKKGGF